VVAVETVGCEEGRAPSLNLSWVAKWTTDWTMVHEDDHMRRLDHHQGINDLRGVFGLSPGR
jgi:hypothetical protein